MKRTLLAVSAILTAASLLAGCNGLMGGLRRDLDDGQDYASQPTVGGAWTERGMLSENMDDSPYADAYGAIGHSSRNPASDVYRGAGGRESWVGEDQARDAAREMRRGLEGEDGESPNYSNDPNMLPPAQARVRYKNGQRATRADFVDEAANEASLWASDGQTNYYFTKNKIRGVGDIISVNIEQGMVKDVGYEVARTLTERERKMELDLAQERIRAKALGLPDPDAKEGSDQVATSSAAPTGAPKGGAEKKEVDEMDIRAATLADVDVTKSLEIKPGDMIMAEIVDRYPNGNYKVRGSKKVPYRGGARIVTMLGIVKGSDIGEDDTIASGKLYEYRLEALR